MKVDIYVAVRLIIFLFNIIEVVDWTGMFKVAKVISPGPHVAHVTYNQPTTPQVICICLLFYSFLQATWFYTN